MNQRNKFTVTPEELRRMREVDIRTVDRDSLTDIAEVKINTELPQEERVLDFIRQIGNPYCYISNGMVVKVSFSGKKSMEDCMKAAMFAED
ncbi:MAG: hypothetical protein LUG99_11015 [Lachnospiraceae bacterium]|nr:hypothetical protein [Lachnospiraceae bacterium]MCD8013688.1 hypothetical protein [Lachnospiraceae bacterium]